MTNNLEQEIREVLAHMESGENEQEPETETQDSQAADGIQDIYVLVVREREEQAENQQVVDSALVPPQKPSMLPAYLAVSAYLYIILSTILFQIWVIFNPPTVHVTIIPKAVQVAATGTMYLGRYIAPITLSQSQTVPATGKGHQDARQASGFITFFNGQLNSITVPAGTVLSGASGIPIVTDQDAVIPPADLNANPPVFGHATVSGRAIHAGNAGNIGSFDINQPCCFASVFAKNLTPFTGGADERNFQTVAKTDIDPTSEVLKTTIAHSVTGALQGQLKPQEQLQLLPCEPTVSSNHQPGQEAREVKISVSETCSAVAYKSNELLSKATDLLSRKALQKLGTDFSLFGQVQVSIIQATVTRAIPTLIFSCQGTWVYAISPQAQQHIKQLIAGKPRDEAIKVLLSLPGIERASIEGEDNSRLPKNITYMHFQIIIQSR